MLYVILRGRLGNNLFQIATAASLTQNFIFCTVNKDQERQVLLYKDSFFKNIKVMKGVPDGIPYYKEPFHEFSRIPYEEGKDLIIDGYFQSEKYFKRSVVLDLYRITDELRKKIWNICGNILEKGETVSIHVRRGDYLKLPHALPFCGKSYYKNAIQYIGEDKIFIICSDDIDWCKKNFIGKRYYFIENTTPLLDLYIQSLCTHNIISNSSFSWWGAWLNENSNKIVIAPQMWFGISVKLGVSDLLLVSWVRLPNNYTLGRYCFALYKVVEDYLLNILRLIWKRKKNM